MHMVTLWTEAEYGPSSVLQILDCPSTPDTPISVTVCDFLNYSGIKCGKLEWKKF